MTLGIGWVSFVRFSALCFYLARYVFRQHIISIEIETKLTTEKLKYVRGYWGSMESHCNFFMNSLSPINITFQNHCFKLEL